MSAEWGPIIPWKPGDGRPTTGTIRRIFDAKSPSGAVEAAPEVDALGVSTSSWEGVIAYRVKLEPVVETVRLSRHLFQSKYSGAWCLWADHTTSAVSISETQTIGEIRNGFLVYETRDGKPDMATLRWEDAD